jgi:hypothetical protein
MNDTRAWRVGTHYSVHGYAENVAPFDDEPIFTALQPEIARQIVDEHEALRAHYPDACCPCPTHREVYRRAATGELLKENTELRERVATLTKQVTRQTSGASQALRDIRLAQRTLADLVDGDVEAACE